VQSRRVTARYVLSTAAMLLHILSCLLLWLHPDPRNTRRLAELELVALDIASTDASEEEAEVLVSVCLHESRCHLRARGDGGHALGPWQIHGPDPSAAEALRRLRWSWGACGDLSLYAGCGRCGACPDVVASLLDPTLPRR
jgi:hypothetical protein